MSTHTETTSSPEDAKRPASNTEWAISLFGTAVGAGILFLPINAGSFGFWPLLVATILIGPMTYFSHRGLARMICASPRQGEDITMIGLDVTLQTLLTTVETKQWGDLGTAGGDFLATATNYYIKAYETTAPHLGGCGLHDPLAVAVAADPSLVDTLAINLKVDTDGETRGRTIGDEARLSDPVKNTYVAVGVEANRFVGELMARTLRLFDTK